MKLIGQADGLEYINARFIVQSWWLLTAVNKKTEKTAKIEMVLFYIFNPDGKIAVQIGFYNHIAHYGDEISEWIFFLFTEKPILVRIAYISI